MSGFSKYLQGAMDGFKEMLKWFQQNGDTKMNIFSKTAGAQAAWLIQLEQEVSLCWTMEPTVVYFQMIKYG